MSQHSGRPEERDRQSEWLLRYFVFVRWVVPLIALVTIMLVARCQR